MELYYLGLPAEEIPFAKNIAKHIVKNRKMGYSAIEDYL